MSAKPHVPSKADSILVIGAGIFGLSTAIHLAERGYANVTLLDKQPYEKTLYSYANGCDAASADINKIIRSAYGSQKIYQTLSLEAIDAWNTWTQELRSGGEAVPPGMTSQDDLWINSGDLSCTDMDDLSEQEKATIRSMEKAGYRDTQLINNNSRHLQLAAKKGFGPNMQPFGKAVLGVLDTTGGVAFADKACRFALHKSQRLGVRCILVPAAGHVLSMVEDDATSRVLGVRTADGTTHRAALTIFACGGWTPSMVPSLDGLAEATAGSVTIFKIPEHLRARFSPSIFPAWSFKITDGAEAGLYGFPVDEHGDMKIGYRGTKYTNPRLQTDGLERSVPITRWTKEEQLNKIPAQAVKVIRRFIDEYLPELAGVDITMTRLCWYTDSFDNHFIIDHVPEKLGLMVATAGSGHAFKYLPNIGRLVVDIIEGRGLESVEGRAWRWRLPNVTDKPVNKLMEGSSGKSALKNVPLTSGAIKKSKL